MATSILEDTSVVVYEALLEEQKALTKTENLWAHDTNLAVVDKAYDLNVWFNVRIRLLAGSSDRFGRSCKLEITSWEFWETK